MKLSPVNVLERVSWFGSGNPARVVNDWFRDLERAVLRAPERLAVVALTGQTVTIPSTVIPTQTRDAGLYRVSVALNIERPSSGTHAVQVVIGFTCGGLAKTLALTPYTGGQAASEVVLIRIDQNTEVTYAVAYSSTGATAAVYAVDLLLEQVSL